MKKFMAIALGFTLLFTMVLATSCAPKPSEDATEPSANTDDRLTVETKNGLVKGVLSDGVVTYKGIPYAQPPVGELRFAPPQPVKSWEGVLDCSSFKPIPVQPASMIPSQTPEPESEDCLYLNIWAPENAAGKKLPVYVFIYGGAFTIGSPSMPEYDGTAFAKDGIIQINIAYRVNALGFMANSEIEEKYGNYGNMGLLDQVEALKWIHENIENFGGDPGNVTVGGESAGSYTTSCLIQMPEAKGLFQKAIMESGNIVSLPLMGPTFDMASSTKQVSAFMKEVGAQSLAELQALDARILADTSKFNVDFTNPAPYHFSPVLDGKLLPLNPYENLKSGNINEVDILVGFNTDEGSLFIPRDQPDSAYESYLKIMLLGDMDKVKAVMDRYPIDADHNATERIRYVAKMAFRMGNDVYADVLSGKGKNAYLYNYDYTGGNEMGLGAAHGDELNFVFKTLPESMQNEMNFKISDEIHNRWLHFIKTGNPNDGTESSGTWAKYTSASRNMMVFNETSKQIVSNDWEDIEFFRDLLWK